MPESPACHIYRLLNPPVVSCYVFTAVMLMPVDDAFYFDQIKTNIHHVTSRLNITGPLCVCD